MRIRRHLLTAPIAPSLRFVPIYRRNLLVWRKLAVPSLVANVVEPLITLVAFGYGLGALLPQVGDMRYIEFLAAGALCMSTMMAASFEALYSAFSRMHVQRTWESLLNAPLELDDVVAAEWLWAASKGVLSAVAILAVVFALGVSRAASLPLALLVAALAALCFAAIGLCVNALAKGYDFFSYYFTLALTPMIFVSGVYYPQTSFPPWMQQAAHWLPLAAAVDLVRPLMLGRMPERIAGPLLLLLGYTVGAYLVALWLTRRRFRV